MFFRKYLNTLEKASKGNYLVIKVAICDPSMELRIFMSAIRHPQRRVNEKANRKRPSQVSLRPHPFWPMMERRKLQGSPCGAQSVFSNEVTFSYSGTLKDHPRRIFLSSWTILLVKGLVMVFKMSTPPP